MARRRKWLRWATIRRSYAERTARGQLLYEVAQAYYDALLSDRLVTIAAATFEQAGATLKQRRSVSRRAHNPSSKSLPLPCHA